MIREAKKEDLEALLELYLYLHEDSIPKHDEHLEKIWNQIIEDSNHHLIVNEIDGQIISSCVCVIIPNLTRNIRPYAFDEMTIGYGNDANRDKNAGKYLRKVFEIAKNL